MLRNLISRAGMVRDAVALGWPLRVPTLVGDPAVGTVIALDGVAGLLLAPVLVRRAIREAGLPYATNVFDWHVGIRGELLADLIWLRRNRIQAIRLARLIRRLRREHPQAPVHVVAYSGGTGVAAFAAEALGARIGIDTLVLCCSALSPEYPLDAMLRHVRRCYAFASKRDVGFLALGTSLFGTIDRRYGRAAGLVGFRQPLDPALAAKFEQIWWTPDMRRYGHHGHHVGTATTAFIRHCIAPLLRPEDAT